MDIVSVYKDINDCFDLDLELNEFDIIPTISSSIIYLDHKLAIPSNVVKPLYQFIYQKLDNFNRNRYINEISLFTDRDEANELIHATRFILLVKGDDPIAFHRRKELIINNFLDCTTELSFLNVLFTKHPKSPCAWQHRRFCLLRKHGLAIPPSVAASELEVCRRFAEIYPKNYYAWLHRLYLIEHFSLSEVRCVIHTVMRDLIMNTYSDAWRIEVHLRMVGISCF